MTIKVIHSELKKEKIAVLDTNLLKLGIIAA